MSEYWMVHETFCLLIRNPRWPPTLDIVIYM